MNRTSAHWLWLLLIVTALFFGCGQKPGAELYDEALTAWEAGNLTRARTLLETSIQRRAGSIENADASNRLGLLLWELNEPQEAVNAFNESLQINPSQHDVLCNLGVALCSVQNFTEAESAFSKARTLKPDDPRPLAYAGIVYAKNKKWNDALRMLSTAVLQKPNDPQLQTALALAELQTGRPGPALQRLENVANNYPDYAPALFNLGAVYRYKIPDQINAKAWFQRYLEKSSGDDAFFDIAHSQIQALNTPGQAPTLTYNRPAIRNRAASQAHAARAVDLYREGKTDEAIRAYTLAIEADDSYERAFYNLGLAYYADGQVALAGEAFAKAVQLNPAYVEARFNLAMVNHYHLGNTSKALRELQTVLLQKPDYQPAIDLLKRIGAE
jgi:tetratricopeptide (TPR) repeat protein